MFDISGICRKYGKRSSQFTDNKVCKNYQFSSRRGVNGYTNIHDDLKYEFLLWVSDETRDLLKTTDLNEVFTIAQKGISK